MTNNKLISLVKSIYLNYSINFFSLNILIILLYLFDFTKLVNETALLTSFIVLICQVFSGNSRTLILANKDFINADDVIILRLLFLFPITIFTFVFIYIYDFSDISFASSIVFLVLSQWVYEIYLSKKEIESKKIVYPHFLLSFVTFLLVLVSLFLQNILFLKIIIFTYSIIIFYFSVFYLLSRKRSIPKIIIDIKSLFNILIFSSYGSSLSVAVSNFFFRYFLIKLVGEDLSSTLIICFMAGSFPVSMFTHIIGASLFRFKINFRKIFKFIFLFFACITFLVILMISDLLFDINSRALKLNEIERLTIGISLIGIYPMMLGLFRRQFYLNNSIRRENFFYLDIIYSLSVILVIPILYIINNENYFSLSFLITGTLSYLIFNFSKILNKEKIIKVFVFLIPLPIFFSLFDGFKKFSFAIMDKSKFSDQLLDFFILPLPISCLVVPFLLISLLSNTKNRTTTIYFVSLSIFTALFSLSLSNRFNFSNLLNFVQFYLPTIAIVCGEIIGASKRYYSKYLKYFMIVALTIIISQIISTLTYKTDFLNPDILFLYIYQTEQYSSLALVFIFFIYIQKILFNKNNIFFNYKPFLALLILSVYIYLSYNATLYLYFLLYLIFLIAFTKKYIFNYLIFLVFLIFIINKMEINLNLNEILVNRTHWYNTYFVEITFSIQNLLFGSNINNELYINTSGVYNYYLDFVYNFGLASIIPLIILMFLTIKKTYVLRKTFKSDLQNATIFLILIIVLFVDSFLKVSLKQPYIGIIIFFIWGIYFSNLTLKEKKS